MLVLSRKLGESIVIAGNIVVKVMRVDGEVVKLGIEAPAAVPVHRQEVYEAIQRENMQAGRLDPKDARAIGKPFPNNGRNGTTG